MSLTCSYPQIPASLTNDIPVVDPNEVASQWSQDAANAFAAIGNTFSNLGSLIYDFSIDSVSDISEFSIPPKPGERSTAYETPENVDSSQLTPIDGFLIGTAPTFSDSLVIDTSGQPGPAPDPWFGDPPAVVSPEIPVQPTYVAPAVPEIDGIVIPNFAPIASIDPSVTIPTFTIPDLSFDMDFTNNQWSSVDLADMADHMDRVRNGDFAIGTVIWQQIFDRAAMQLRREAITRERQSRRAWASKGWTMPGGVALAGAELAAHDINESTSMKALEIAVQEAVQKDDQFWKSMTQGVAIESLYEKAHASFYERSLRFAIAYQDAHVAIYNALVAKFNAEVAAAQMQIESKRLEIENQRLKLEEYKLQIEAALARGEADKLELQLYIAQWEGIKAAIDVYKAQLEGVKLNIDSQRLVLESHGLNVEQFKTLVEAWAKEWDGYSAKMDGETAKANVFDSQVKAYTARVGAYSAQASAEEARVKSETEFARLQQEMYRFDIERFKAEWDAISARLDSVARLTQSDATMYTAEVQAAVSQAETQTKIAQINLDIAKATQLGAIEAARMQVEQAIAQARLAESAEEALGNIYAQLVSAAYNTVSQNSSFGRSMSYSVSTDVGIQCS